MAPDVPKIPSFDRLKVFAWGLLWAALHGAIPATALILGWLQDMRQPLDWPMVAKVAAAGAGAGVVGYWRKHRAWLMEPPVSDAEMKAAASRTAAAGSQ